MRSLTCFAALLIGAACSSAGAAGETDAFVDEQIERICITMKSGFLFLFGCIAETYGVGKQKVKEVTYLTSEEYNSLKCYLKGDFCRNVA